MSYVLQIGPAAELQLAQQPEPLRSFIEASLRRLAASPSLVRGPVAQNYPGPAAEFKFDQQGVTLWVTVEFRYGADEQTLHIERIRVEFGA